MLSRKQYKAAWYQRHKKQRFRCVLITITQQKDSGVGYAASAILVSDFCTMM